MTNTTNKYEINMCLLEVMLAIVEQNQFLGNYVTRHFSELNAYHLEPLSTSKEV